MREQLFEVRFAVLMNALRPTRKKEFVQKLLKEASFRNGWPYKFRLIHSHLISLFHLTHSHTSHPPGQLHSRPLHHGQLNHRACAEWDSNHHGCRDPTTTCRGCRYVILVVLQPPWMQGSHHYTPRGQVYLREGSKLVGYSSLEYQLGLFFNLTNVRNISYSVLLSLIFIPNFVRHFRAKTSSRKCSRTLRVLFINWWLKSICLSSCSHFFTTANDSPATNTTTIAGIPPLAAPISDSTANPATEPASPATEPASPASGPVSPATDATTISPANTVANASTSEPLSQTIGESSALNSLSSITTVTHDVPVNTTTTGSTVNATTDSPSNVTTGSLENVTTGSVQLQPQVCPISNSPMGFLVYSPTRRVNYSFEGSTGFGIFLLFFWGKLVVKLVVFIRVPR